MKLSSASGISQPARPAVLNVGKHLFSVCLSESNPTKTPPSGGSRLPVLEPEMGHRVVRVELGREMQGEIPRAEVAQVAVMVVLAGVEVAHQHAGGLGARAQDRGTALAGWIGVAGDVEVA